MASKSRSSTKVQEKDVTEWIFKRFNELTEPNITAQQREEILYRVFSMLQKCDKSWQCQLDILDVFGNIIKNKPEILFGCSNILDLVITMIENLENNPNKTNNGNNNNEQIEMSINTIHCKLCHLISIVGRTQLSVQHLTRILVLLRDSLLNKNRKSLAPLLLSTLKDMTRHSPPFYDNHQQNHSIQQQSLSSQSNSSSSNSSSSNSSQSPRTSPHSKHKKSNKKSSHQLPPPQQQNNEGSWMPSPQKLIPRKIVNVFSQTWFDRDNGSSTTNNQQINQQSHKSSSSQSKQQSQSESSQKKKSRKKHKNTSSLPNINTLLHIIHQLPLSSFAFLNTNKSSSSTSSSIAAVVQKNNNNNNNRNNNNKKKQCSIDVPMKYIKKWPYERGFTFVCWILYHQLSPHVYNKNSWMTIFSMLTTSGYGINISLCCKSGSIKIRITAKNIVDEKIIPKARLLASTWYFIGITHCQSRTAALRLLRPSHSNGQCKVYINGNKITTIDIEYPEIKEKPKYCSIGRSSFPSDLSSSTSTSSSFCGQLGSIYFFGNPLSSNQVSQLYSFGANYMIKPEIVKQSNANWIINTLGRNIGDITHIGGGSNSALNHHDNANNQELNDNTVPDLEHRKGKPSGLKRTESDLLLGGSSMGQLDNFKFANSRDSTSLRAAPLSMQTSASSVEIEIFQNLMFAYHPLATEISNKLCLNVGSSIYLHGKIQGDVEIFKTKDVRNIFHCSIGGLLALFPILTQLDDDNNSGDQLISSVFDLVSQLLHFSLSNQIQIQRSSGIPILGYLLQQIPSKYITKKVLTSIHNFCCHLSWLGHEDEINSKTSPIEDSILFSHLPPSLSSCEQFNQIRPNINLLTTRYQYNLFNQSVQYLILNFKIWHRDDYNMSDHQNSININIDNTVENQLVDILTIWCKDQPKYMYQLIHIGFLLNEIRQHYSYEKVDEKHKNKKKKYLWLWNIRQYWFNIIIYLIQHNLTVNKHVLHTSSIEHVDLLLQMAVELTDPLECADIMEIIVSLCDKSDKDRHNNNKDNMTAKKMIAGLILKNKDSNNSLNSFLNNSTNEIVNHLMSKNCMKLFGVLFRQQCVNKINEDRDYLQVCCLHLINKLNLYKEEEESFVVALISSFMEKEIPLVTYHAFLEIILFKQPGSIGVKHGTEFYVKKHELIQSQHYIEHLQNAFVKYPQALIQLLRCKFPETKEEEYSENNYNENNGDHDNNSNIKYDKNGFKSSEKVKMKTVLQDFVSLLAASRHSKENASSIVASRGFQEPFIKLIDFCNVNLQSETDSLSWYGETCLDLLLQYSLLYDNRGWKILRDTFRIMRHYCEYSKISLIYCVISQCYLFIRILKRLASLIHQEIELHNLNNNNQQPFDTNIVIVNIVRCLELIEIIIYELPPGLFSYKIEAWIVLNENNVHTETTDEFAFDDDDTLINHHDDNNFEQRPPQRRRSQQQHQQHQNEDKKEQFGNDEDSNEIDSSVMDEIWILLCSSILSVMESIPKCNLSPHHYREITSPPLKTGSPFRVLLRLLLSCLERNIESETQTASIKTLIQNALQFLTVEQHPSMKYIGSLSFVVRRFHGEELNNQFTIFLIKSLHDLYVQCKNTKSKHYIKKLIEFVIKSREPVSFVPIDMFHDENLFLTCKVNNGEIFASIVDQAKNQKLTHLAIPVSSKLLVPGNNNVNSNMYRMHSRDMGFTLNTARLKFVANNVAKNKRIEIMIMERVQSDIKANMKFIANLNFVNFEKGNVEVLESNAIRKLLERMDNRQRNYLEYYKHNMLDKQQDILNKYAYTEANRKVFSLNQSDEKLKRGKMYWLECKPHIYCQGSVWFDENEASKKKFWQIDSWENSHRMRLKLIEYKGGLIKTRSAGDSHSSISKLNSNLNKMHELNLTQSIANLNEWGIFDDNKDSATDTTDDEEELSALGQDRQNDDNNNRHNRQERKENEKDDKPKEDGWDYCEDSHINYELEDMIIHEVDEVLLVSPIGNYQGQIKITRSYFQFICIKSREKYEKIVAEDEEKLMIDIANNSSTHKDMVDSRGDRKIFSLPALNKIRLEESRDRYISLDQIHAVFRRRYQLQHSALEIYLLDGKSYFFEVGNKQKRNEILKVLFSHSELKGSCPNTNKLFSRKPLDILRESNITERWQRREISNFDYLMQLNTISGRTYNDVNQYPIFPWILTDYVSPELDLSNPSVFRDLSKPMGALNPDRLKTIIKKYKGLLEDTSVPAFHYGSHYSNGAIVISYLLRLEPFSSLHIELQGGKFDFPDRLFSSLQQSWDAVISSLTTFKELIPEFFYLPHILRNVNCYDLGRRQNGELVDDVKLPPWASSADDFVRKHRAALESPYVSAHLHHWIDLIWGYKQRGKPAEEANNLFYHLTYEGAVKLDEMEDEILKRAMKEQIANFGQTPIQLFNKQHVERDPQTSIVPYAWKIGNKYQKIPALHDITVHKSSAIQKLLILSTMKAKDYNFNVLVTISVTGCPFGHTLYLEDRENTNNKGKQKMKIPSIIRDLYTYRTPPPQYDTPSFVLFEQSHISKYHPSSLTKATQSCIAYNNNIVYVGNNWDSSLRVYRLDYSTSTNNINDDNQNRHKKSSKKSKPHLGHIKWRLIQSFISHKSRISCIDTDGIHLASGSDDCTVVIWQINNHKKTKNIDHFTFDQLLNKDSNNSNNKNNNSSKSDNIIGGGNNHYDGLISSSKCVLRGHQSPIVAIALNSELDICVSCSSQGQILIHTVQHGEYRYALYLSGDICGRGTLLNNIQFKHIPDGAREYPMNINNFNQKIEPHPDVKFNPFDQTSYDDEYLYNDNLLNPNDIMNSNDNISGSDMDLSSDNDESNNHNNNKNGDESKNNDDNNNKNNNNNNKRIKSRSRKRLGSSSSSSLLSSNWGERCQIDIVKISCDGRIVFLSKQTNMIFSCNINGMNWNSLKVTDNLTSIDIDKSGKLLLTAGQCGIGKIRFIHSLSRNVYKFTAVGDSITIAKFDDRNNRVYIATESGNLHFFALPHLTRIRSIIDTLPKIQ